LEVVGVRNHGISVGLGIAMAVVGLVLWRTTGNVHLPFLALSKIGFVLLVLGLIEVVVSGLALLDPATRHRHYDL
jgi:hypothetical protein